MLYFSFYRIESLYILFYKYIYTYAFGSFFYPMQLTLHSRYTSLSVHVFVMNQTHDLGSTVWAIGENTLLLSQMKVLKV